MMLISTDVSVKRQHDLVRNTAGWYYFTHHLVEVTGTDAAALLDYIYTGAISKVAVGRAKYTTMLKPNGLIYDDVIIFRIEENKYWISTLHRPRTLQMLAQYAGQKDVQFRSITEQWDMYAVQGPNAKDFVNAVLNNPVDDMKFFSIADNMIGDLSVKVARSGYTGEKWGYEIYVAPDKKELVEQALEAKEAEFGADEITEVDVMAYTLATEKGYVLVTDINHSTPFEVDMDKGIDWSKDFIGKEALLTVKDLPPKHKLVGITVDEKFVKVHGGPKGAPVSKNGKVIGRVTKFTYGFTVDKWVGFALIDAGSAQIGDHVILNNNTLATITERPVLK